MSEAFDQVIAYHLRTKHQPHAGSGPGKNGLGSPAQPLPEL
jgi:hypothetical protein